MAEARKVNTGETKCGLLKVAQVTSYEPNQDPPAEWPQKRDAEAESCDALMLQPSEANPSADKCCQTNKRKVSCLSRLPRSTKKP